MPSMPGTLRRKHTWNFRFDTFELQKLFHSNTFVWWSQQLQQTWLEEPVHPLEPRAEARLVGRGLGQYPAAIDLLGFIESSEYIIWTDMNRIRTIPEGAWNISILTSTDFCWMGERFSECSRVSKLRDGLTAWFPIASFMFVHVEATAWCPHMLSPVRESTCLF